MKGARILKIIDVKAYLLPKRPPPHPFRWRDGLPGSDPYSEPAVLRVVTDAGVEGFSQVPRGRIFLDLVARRIRPLLLGEDALLKERLWKKVWEVDRIEEFPIYALGAVDMALWDLTGKAAGLPLYRLFGGFRDAIPAYASTVTFGSVEAYLDVADQCLALGYPAVKLHAWGDARRDAALCEALRAHVGDEVPLMYDGSAGFDFQDALYLGKALEHAGFLWYEEPMREFSISSYRRLRDRLSIPLLVAETSDGSHYNTADFIHFQAGDIVRTSTGFKGGFTGALRIAHLADAFQLRAEVHGGGLPNLHVALAIPNTTYYESLVDANPVAPDPLVDRQGLVHAPSEPGTGAVYDPARLEHEAQAVV